MKFFKDRLHKLQDVVNTLYSVRFQEGFPDLVSYTGTASVAILHPFTIREVGNGRKRNIVPSWSIAILIDNRIDKLENIRSCEHLTEIPVRVSLNFRER